MGKTGGGFARAPLLAVAASLAVASVACGVASDGRLADPAAGSCRVTLVIDGDSLACSDGREVRLLLIDAPELAQEPWGGEARAVLAGLAGSGTALEIEHDVERLDAFGRHLAYLYLTDGRMVNEEVALRGYALALVIPPNGRHEARIRAAVKEAMAAGRGLWAEWGFACPPADFRAGECE